MYRMRTGKDATARQQKCRRLDMPYVPYKKRRAAMVLRTRWRSEEACILQNEGDVMIDVLFVSGAVLVSVVLVVSAAIVTGGIIIIILTRR